MKNSNLLNRLWKDSHEKQSPQRFARYAVMLMMLLTLGVGQMWAGPSFSGGYAYFYNKGGWSDNSKQLCIGRDKWGDDWTEVRTMTAISNTKLWYNSLPTSGWGDATYMAVIGNSSAWSSNNWGSGNLTNANHRTGAVSLGDWGFGSGNVNMLTPASGNNDATLALSYVGNAYSSLNKTITIKAKVSTNNGSSYTETTTPAALDGASKVFTSYTSCAGTSGASATLSVGISSTTFKAGYTATTTLTAPSTDPSGYKFAGWYDSDGSLVGATASSKTATVYPTADATYYAYYRKLYTISAGTTVVWDLCGNEKSWSAAYLYKDIEGGSTSNDDMTQCGSTTQYRKTYASAVSNVKVFLFRGQNGSTWSDHMQTTDLYRNVSGVTLYEFDNSYTGVKLNWQVTTGAKKATSGTKVYFDNTATNWNEVWLKYGTTRFNRHSGAAATKVTGTDNLYVITMPEAYYVKWYFADAYGYTNRNSIETMTSINNRINYQTTDLTSDVTYIPSTGSGTPKVWNTTTLSGHTRTLTFGSHTNGNITVRYTDESGTERTVSSASVSSVSVAQTCKVIITAVPNSGYAPSTLTLGGASITSGAQQIIRADGTIVATFVAEETHDVTVSYKIGSRTLHADQTFEVGVTTASNISSEEIDGFSFSSWSNLSSDIVNNTGNLTTDPININTTVDGGDCSMTCNYTQWPCSLDVVESSGSTGYSSRLAMTYDATEKAYYKEFTTTAATQYFRFYINSKKYAPSSDTEVPIDGTEVTAATDVTGYASNMPSVYFNDGGSGSKIKVWFDYEAKKAWVEEVKYTVTVSAGDNGEVEPTSVSVGNVVASSTISATADDHYHWSSWDVPSGVTIVSGSGTKDITIKATAAGTLTANFAGDQYTITYRDKGDVAFSGSQTTPPTTHTYGTATTLRIPTKTGYDFGGWFTASDCASGAVGNTTSASLGATAFTDNITLYAKWTAKNYTATNNLQDADGNAGQYNVDYDATSIAHTSAPSRSGYTVEGYYKQAAWTNKIANTNLSLVASTDYATSASKWKVTSAPDLYIKWQQTLTLAGNGAGSTDGSLTMTYNSTTTSGHTAATRTGYTLNGYYDNTSGGNKILTNTGALVTYSASVSDYINSSGKWIYNGTPTLSAQWTAREYTISFDADDEDRVGTATNMQGDVTVTFDDDNFSAATVKVPVLTGYTFGGFYTAVNGGGKQIVNASGVWQSSKDDYTDVSGNWIYPDDVTLYAKWTAKTYTVSFDKGSGTCATASTTVTFGATYGEGAGLAGALPTATAPSGYVFGGWFDAAAAGSKVEASTQVTTASDHTIYARYTQRDRVYFYNNLGWEAVYVNYDAYWVDDTYGAANKGKTYQAMTQIGSSNVWYADIPDAILSSWKFFVAFNTKEAGSGGTGTYDRFDDDQVVFRHDFDSYATMFVPQSSKSDKWDKNEHDTKKTTYYSSSWTYDAKEGDHGENYRQNVGYWMRYNDINSGYSITGTWDSWAQTTKLQAKEAGTAPYTVTKILDANTTYDFLVYKDYTNNSFNHIFTNTGTITSASCTDVEFTSANTKYSSLASNHAHITTTVAGEYTFKLTPGTDGTLKISVEYPFGVNDYRILYSWNDGEAHEHASEIIKAEASSEKTISVFVHKASAVSSQSLKVQQCTAIDGSGVPTWADRGDAISLSSVKESGVYNFVITQGATGYATGAFSGKYEGNYYIRTESADGGWNNYKEHEDNIMTLSDYSLTQTLSPAYSHYYCRYIESTAMDITYQIATDYSPCVSDVMVGDATIGDASTTTLPASANVRFSWNEQTNAMRRAYLKSAQGDINTRYLVLHGEDDGMIYNNDNDGTAIAANPSKSLEKNELLFTDIGNWIYQVELKAQPGSKIKLIANYNSSDRYLVGDATHSQTLIGGSGSTKYPITAVYDFKTNRLMTAWTPTGAITDVIEDVDIMIVRHGQEQASTITFGEGGSLNANKVIGALEMRYDELFGRVANWTAASRPLLKFMISFPFDVNVSDIFGLNSAYGDAYVIERYAGDQRAEKGFFRGDGTTTFWEELTIDSVMHANEGYCVILDNDYFNSTSYGKIWENKSSGSKVYLYFPSATDVGDIEASSKTITIPAHECTINRTWGGGTKNHTNTDSHWNMVGVPLFSNHAASTAEGTPGAVLDNSDLHYYYAWNPSDNQFATASAADTTFKAMHAFMVQYTGDLKFVGSITTPTLVPARRTAEMKNYKMELQVLNSNEETLNRAFVELSDGASDDFMLNEDLFMSTNNRAVNIYTFAGDYDVAANVLSIDNHVVPVGVIVNKAGTYTFSMPSNFSGTVTLVDTFTQTRTNLAMGDYEVYLNKGTINDRFLLEINIHNAPTAIDGVEDGSLKDGKAHKFLQNGLMYILRDGKLYDAQGKRLQ